MSDPAWFKRLESPKGTNFILVRSVGAAVEDVYDALAAGATLDELQLQWPGIEREDVEAVTTLIRRDGIFVGTFEQWVSLVFDHPVTGPAWHDTEDADRLRLLPRRELTFMTRLCREGDTHLSAYLDAQIERGFWYLCGECFMSTFHLDSPAEAHVECIESMPLLFERMYSKRCTESLSHLGEPGAALNGSCYMWWDMLNIRAPRNAFGDTILRAMESQLAVNHVAVQESALHGLGHSHHDRPSEVEAIIDCYLRRFGPFIRPELMQYAEAARIGYVQ